MDYSSMGNQQASAGPTVIFLLVLLRMVLEWKPDIFIHENVLPFPTENIKEVLSVLYEIEEGILTPDFFPVDRRRRYMICRLKTSLRLLGNISKSFLYD